MLNNTTPRATTYRKESKMISGFWANGTYIKFLFGEFYSSRARYKVSEGTYIKILSADVSGPHGWRNVHKAPAKPSMVAIFKVEISHQW